MLFKLNRPRIHGFPQEDGYEGEWKNAQKQRDCPKLLGIVGPFLARFIKILPKSPKSFKYFIYFRVLTKATAILYLTTFYLF